MNIYLDIDGVLLTKDGKQMPFLNDFINTISSMPNSEMFWLTTHCKENSTIKVFNHIDSALDQEIITKLKIVKSTKWDTLKTEAIDFTGKFLWFDDNILEIEKKILSTNNALTSWIKVENNLETITKYLRENFCR
jgi:hypothetical protein